jgi:hypothetical protein
LVVSHFLFLARSQIPSHSRFSPRLHCNKAGGVHQEKNFLHYAVISVIKKNVNPWNLQ